MACLYRHILTFDFHVTIRCTDSNTREGIDFHITPRRLDRDISIVGTALDTPKTILIAQFNTTFHALIATKTSKGRICRIEALNHLKTRIKGCKKCIQTGTIAVTHLDRLTSGSPVNDVIGPQSKRHCGIYSTYDIGTLHIAIKEIHNHLIPLVMLGIDSCIFRS